MAASAAARSQGRGTASGTADGSTLAFARKSSRVEVGYIRQRMQVAHQALQPLLQHMGVDLRRRDVGMAEQRLHDAQVGAVLQQMAGEGVAQHVRADLARREAGGAGQRLQVAGEMLPRQMAALAEGRKQPFRAGVSLAGVLALSAADSRVIACRGGVVERHQPLLVALAAHHQHALVAPRGRRAAARPVPRRASPVA